MLSPVSASERPRSGRAQQVLSSDGTSIGFRTTGSGPDLVLLHGAGQTAGSLAVLAGELAGDFTVHVLDRRGRGLSPIVGTYEGLATEVADLQAVLDVTGACLVFGLSSGAVIALETARIRPSIAKLALYEPPLSFDGVVHGEWLPRYEALLSAGRPGSALVTVIDATGDRTLFRLVPNAPLGRILDFAIRRTADRAAAEGTLSPRELVPTIRLDAMTVRQAAGPLERFAELGCEVLLVGGTRSARNLTASLDGLARALPGARRRMLRGAGHTAPDNSKRPRLVARELRTFFG
jgi:pimeloyl-ACP methyl ester carboxylesterase